MGLVALARSFFHRKSQICYLEKPAGRGVTLVGTAISWTVGEAGLSTKNRAEKARRNSRKCARIEGKSTQIDADCTDFGEKLIPT
jgi:hypothetical protein